LRTDQLGVQCGARHPGGFGRDRASNSRPRPQIHPILADIRDIAKLRTIADQTETEYGKVDIVVANAAIQRWKGLMEMNEGDWRDLIDNNLNGTANTIRAFAPKMIPRKYGRIIVLSSMQANTAPRTHGPIPPRNGEFLG
jgi:NAD(P)-dependent dehydrogenase (short-subunit alcohol dehydrogenase family)